MKTKLTSDAEVECTINRLGLNAPRVTPADIDAAIASKQFYIFPGTQLTVCCLTLTNGYNVIGESACASPENFNKEIGESIAFTQARDKIWALEGYLLKTKLQLENGNV